MILIASILTVLSSCPETRVINISKDPWNARDQKSLEFNTPRCMELFPQSNPCLKIFVKKEPLNYYAICGGTDA